MTRYSLKKKQIAITSLDNSKSLMVVSSYILKDHQIIHPTSDHIFLLREGTCSTTVVIYSFF